MVAGSWWTCNLIYINDFQKGDVCLEEKMNKYRLLTALLSLILMACLSGVEGQYAQYPTSSGYSATLNPISSGYPTTQTPQVDQMTDVSQYSQYYTVGSAPNTHITTPQQFIIEGSTPATVYIGNQQQPVTHSQYQSNPTYAGGNSLWIKGSASWTQYVVVPQGSSIPLYLRKGEKASLTK